VEIKVVVRDAFAASDLTWFLDASARVSSGENGVYVVHVQAGDNVRGVLAEIRKWLTLHQVGPVTVQIGDLEETLSPGLLRPGESG
jgi:hypothetical protein